ncbi:alpha/beta fold hydrolase [Roseicyclus sp.]|uniref:alpha/beta fold hydrolase n=1 Tax=Roseicyclus sp. TaxID=1914329 RepID=UPI003F6B972C
MISQWVHAADGTRLRMAHWPGGTKGTVLLFPGRTEYCEKYALLAGDMHVAGYGMAAFDWRGQGLADRPAHRRDMGHVESFDDYRTDVAAFVASLQDLDAPKPWFLIGHSMGGAIGLRALHDGLPVAAAAFSAPMWDIAMRPALKALRGVLLPLTGVLGLGLSFAATTGPYKTMAFDDNPLTTDRAQFDYMARQLASYPDLRLGGPSNMWVRAAVTETAALMTRAAPAIPTLTMIAGREKIVVNHVIEKRMADWPMGRLMTIDGAEHELLFEAPARRQQALDAILAHFDAHLTAPPIPRSQA